MAITSPAAIPANTQPAPNRADATTFNVRAQAFAEYLYDEAVAGINAAASNVFANATEAYDASITAVGSANFKGAWSSLTGALAIPAAVSHNGKLWLLLVSLGNVTTSEPGVSADWREIDAQPAAPAFGAIGSAVVLGTVNSNFLAACSISATRAFVLRRNSSGFPVVSLVSNTGAVIATSAALDTTVLTGNEPAICRINSTDALAIYCHSTGQVRANVVRDAGASVTVGTIANLGSTDVSSLQAAKALTATKVVALYSANSTSEGNARILTISGLAITQGTPSTLTFDGGINSFHLEVLLAGDGGRIQVLYAKAGTTSVISSQVLTESSTNLTISDKKDVYVFFANATGAASALVAPGKFLLCGGASGSTATAILSDFTFGYLSSGVVFMDGNSTPSTGAYATTSSHRLTALSASTALHLQCNHSPRFLATQSWIVMSAIDTTKNAPVFVAKTTRIAAAVKFEVIVFDATTAMAVYADAANSNYATLKTVALGTIV